MKKSYEEERVIGVSERALPPILSPFIHTRFCLEHDTVPCSKNEVTIAASRVDIVNHNTILPIWDHTSRGYRGCGVCLIVRDSGGNGYEGSSSPTDFVKASAHCGRMSIHIRNRPSPPLLHLPLSPLESVVELRVTLVYHVL
uniref:Uncharacterized protein n=1 Tax=Timema cristinae TaxID=61476 RepID=A0A7R9CCV3_TIMCR|nr:unnamed protein product [Timema cristinae]